MEGTPPPYANYPRNEASLAYGSSSQLLSLHEGYRLYSWVFLANLVLGLVLGFGAGATGNQYLVFLTYPLLMVIGAAMAHPLNKKIGFGANWSISQIWVATVLMGFNSACCGIVGFIVMQQIASNHIKRYGIRGGFFGIRKRDVQSKVAELQAAGR